MRPKQRVVIVTGLASNSKKPVMQEEPVILRDDQETCRQCNSIVSLTIEGSLRKHKMGKGINNIPCPNTTPARYF